MYYVIKKDELYHYGVKGMKWHRHRPHSRDKTITDGTAVVSKGENPMWIAKGPLSLGVGKNILNPRRYMGKNIPTYHEPGHSSARAPKYGAAWINSKGQHERNRKGLATQSQKSAFKKSVDKGKNFIKKLFGK